jgi:hypothetical protein
VFVGVEPQRVQALTLSLTADFLQTLPRGLAPQRRQLGGVTAYVLSRQQAVNWQSVLRN